MCVRARPGPHPRPPSPTPPTPPTGGCWRGAKPPCTYVAAACAAPGSADAASQKWEARAQAGGLVSLVHTADGLYVKHTRQHFARAG